MSGDLKAQVAAVLDPLSDYDRQCHVASIKVVRAGLAVRVARGFCQGVGSQHSWAVLGEDCYAPDVQIIDPTRWSFTDDEPEIGLCDEWEAEDDYDKGGQRLRAALMTPPPPWDPAARTVSLSVPKGSDLEMTLNTLLGEDQHGTDADGYVLTVLQAGWLANLPYEILAPHQKDIYKLLDQVGLLAFVPADNQQMAGVR